MAEGTPLVPLVSGVVTEIDRGVANPTGYGWFVAYKIPTGQEIIYSHVSGFPSGLKVGDTVNPGDVIAFSGSTGRSTAPHLHLGLYNTPRDESSLIDPAPFLQNLARNLQFPVPRSSTTDAGYNGVIATPQGAVRSVSSANPAQGDLLPSSYSQHTPLVLAIPPDSAPDVKPGNNYGYKAISTDTGFRDKLHSVAQNLDTHPQWLADVIAVESGDTFSPTAVNMSSSATGLIGFMEPTARELGTTQTALLRMTRVEQMDYVQKYLEPFKGKLDSVFDIAVAVYRPAYFDRWKSGDTSWQGYDHLEQVYFPMLGRRVGRRYSNDSAANVTHTRYVAGCSICAQAAYGGFIVPHEAQYG